MDTILSTNCRSRKPKHQAIQDPQTQSWADQAPLFITYRVETKLVLTSGTFKNHDPNDNKLPLVPQPLTRGRTTHLMDIPDYYSLLKQRGIGT
jgi:hypothetical protein